jgi:hypothetical protein
LKQNVLRGKKIQKPYGIDFAEKFVKETKEQYFAKKIFEQIFE